MAALSVSIPSVIFGRRSLALTPRRIEANRRNARRSSGPRSAEGKARIARNAIKHGFFVAQERWSPRQHRDFAETLAGLRDELKPQGELEETCVATMAESYIRMAAMLRYENLAALKYHQQCEREMNERIAAANTREAARLRAQREKLRRAGLWRPTIPGDRDARAIIRYSGSLDRGIRRAASALDGLKSMRIGGFSLTSKAQRRGEASPSSVLSAARRTSSATGAMAKVQKQTHSEASPSSVLSAARRASSATGAMAKVQKQTHFEASESINENAKTNPLSSMFMGNRHERRRAKALARQRR